MNDRVFKKFCREMRRQVVERDGPQEELMALWPDCALRGCVAKSSLSLESRFCFLHAVALFGGVYCMPFGPLLPLPHPGPTLSEPYFTRN